MPRTRDQVEYDATKTHIKAIARSQMAANGTAGVSLRAIAREMNITAPALYRYFPSLDDLITALIVDAFNGLADTLEAADASIADRTDYKARILAIGLALRQYALEHRIEYQLIYGNPIPGYTAPREVTVPASVRVHVALTRALVEAESSGAYHLPFTGDELFTEQELKITGVIAAQFGVNAEVIAEANMLWSMLHGVIALDLDGHLDSVIDVEAMYRKHLVRFFRGFS